MSGSGCPIRPLVWAVGRGPEHAPFRTLSSEQEGHQRGGEIVGPLRLKSGGGRRGGPLTVICLDKRGFCHSVSGTLGGDKGASDGRLPSPQEGGHAGAAGCACFQMKLCAWGLSGLRPHSCMSICAACQAPVPGLPPSWGQIGALLFLQGVKEHYPPLCSLSLVATAQGAHLCEAGRKQLEPRRARFQSPFCCP